MLTVLKTFYSNVIKRKSYWIPVALFTVLTYGDALFNHKIGKDDLSFPIYDGIDGLMVRSYRWGMFVWQKLMGISDFSPYIYNFFFMLFLVAAAILFSCIIYSLTKKEAPVYVYTLCSVAFITYPLLCEIWLYSGANTFSTGNMMLVMISVLIHLFSKNKVNAYIINTIILTLVVSSYEAGILVYITTVVTVIFYSYCITSEEKKGFSKWIIDGLAFTPQLIVAMILKYAIGFVIMKVQGLSYVRMGDTYIQWGSSNILQFVKKTVLYYVFNGLIYFPVTVFVVSTFIFGIICVYKSVKQKSIQPIIIGAFLVLSLFAVSIVQMLEMRYRVAQNLNVYTAFIVFLIAYFATMLNKATVKRMVLILLSFLMIYQSTYASRIISLDNLRSENEISIVQQLGMKLVSEYPDKKVVVCGELSMGKYIESRKNLDVSTPLGKVYSDFYFKNSNVDERSNFDYLPIRSFIWWSSVVFSDVESFSANEMLFSYCGYDLDFASPSEEELKEYETIAKENNMAEYEIRDMGDYVLVYLGDGDLNL